MARPHPRIPLEPDPGPDDQLYLVRAPLGLSASVTAVFSHAVPLTTSHRASTTSDPQCLAPFHLPPLPVLLYSRPPSSFSSRETVIRVPETKLQQPVQNACAIIPTPAGTAANRRHRHIRPFKRGRGPPQIPDRVSQPDQHPAPWPVPPPPISDDDEPVSASVSFQHPPSTIPVPLQHASIRASSDILAASLPACYACPWPCPLHPRAKCNEIARRDSSLLLAQVTGDEGL